MDKKILIAICLVLSISIPIITSIPQFLIFQGEVKLDGRVASQGTIVNFSIERTELNHSLVDNESKYGPLFIQGFSEFEGKPINITINNYEAEQKIDYVSPQDIFLDLSALTEKVLKILESFPTENIISVSKTRELSFNVITDSGYDDIVNHTWFLDGKSVLNITNTNESSFSYEVNNSDRGEHNITIFATDGFLTVFKEWTLIIERPETENFDGATTDFDSLGLNELENVPDVILEKTGKGKIEFLENLNLSGVTDLNNKVKIEKGIVAIDTSFYPQLNKPAIITLSGLSYNTIPKIFFIEGFTTNPLLINKECDFCNIISFTNFPTTNGEVIFTVEHFSSFFVGESGDRFNLTDFRDLDLCEEGIIGDLELEIDNPDSGDDFELGDTIKIKVEVTNNADEDKDIIVEASLYNIDEDDEIENVKSNDEEVNEDDSETFKLEIEVPDDFDDKDDYLIFVKAYEEHDEEEQCDQGAVEINLDREKHDVIIKDVYINPQIVYSGNKINVFVDVQNIGSNDEDVYVTLENSVLGISEKSETFELEEFDDDDFFTQIFFVKIPNNAEEGEYSLNIKAVFDGKSDEKTETISILKTLFLTSEFDKSIINIDFKDEKSGTIKIDKKDYSKTISELSEEGYSFVIVLAVGIIILVLLIITVLILRRRFI